MKKIYLFLTVAASISSLTAQQIYEPFTGTGVLTDNGWVNHSGSVSPVSIITTSGDSGNSLSYSGLQSPLGNRISIVAGGAQDVNKALTTPLSSVAYYSLLVKVVNTTGLSTSGDFSISLAQNAGTTGVTTFRAKLYFKTGTASDTFNVGIENSTGGSYFPSYHSVDFPVNTTVLIVVKHDVATNTSSLWVNPVPGSTEPTPNATNASGTTATTSIASICIRQNGTASSGTGNIEFDEIRISDNWADVVPAFLGIDDVKVGKSQPVLSNTLIGDQVSVVLEGISKVEFYSITGSLVKSVTVRSQEPINAQDLQKGMYVVRVINNNKIETVKVIKK